MTTKPPKPTKASLSSPIEIFQTDLARYYTHVHPVLVLTLLYASFNSIVADPVSALGSLAVPLCALQALYAVICLPILPNSTAPSHLSAAKTGQPQQQQQQARRKPAGSKTSYSLSSKIVPTILATLLTLLLSTPLLTVLLILHGAPLTTHLPATTLLSLHLSLLSTLPLFYTHGVSAPKWRDLVSLSAPVDEVTGAAMGALLGAWVGAVPIPLDWDREWQRWPVTVLVGGYGGWAVGKLLGGTVGWGRRIVFGA